MVIQAPEIEEANVTRLAINYYGVDDEGAYTLTITLRSASSRPSSKARSPRMSSPSQLSAQLKRETP